MQEPKSLFKISVPGLKNRDPKAELKQTVEKEGLTAVDESGGRCAQHACVGTV